MLRIGSDKAGRKVLGDADMMFFRGVGVWVGIENGRPVTLNASHFSKRKKNVWQPYMNWYIAFTRIDERRKGYATDLAIHVRNLGVEAGCIRLKALAGTIAGTMFHWSLKDQMWALTPKNEIMVDTPIVKKRFPTDKTPIEARQYTDRLKPFLLRDIKSILKETKLAYEVV